MSRGWPCCSSQPPDMARSTCSAVTNESAASTHVFMCSRANCAGTRILRCRSRKASVTLGERFSPECHQKTDGSPPSASTFTVHSGPDCRRPTVLITSIRGSSTLACPANKEENNSSSRLHPHSSYKTTSGCRPRELACSDEKMLHRECRLGTL